jgi:hypothetical protein
MILFQQQGTGAHQKVGLGVFDSISNVDEYLIVVRWKHDGNIFGKWVKELDPRNRPTFNWHQTVHPEDVILVFPSIVGDYLPAEIAGFLREWGADTEGPVTA